MSFEHIMTWVIEKEGGNADHPLDGGKRTIFGISERFHPEWVGWTKLDNLISRYGKVPKGDILLRELQGDVYDFYRDSYYSKLHCKELNPGIAFALMDYAIQFGVTKASKALQEVVKAKPDGVIGPVTVASCNAMMPEVVLKKLFIERTTDYIQSDSKGRVEFAKGWSNRLWECYYESQDLLE